jgi:hypothetical protein
MVGEYAASPGALELRSPAKLFVPIAWLIAGPLNPVGFFAYLPWNERAWDMPFDGVMWATSVALPLSVGCAASLFYLRGGGFGFLTLVLVTLLTTLAACAVTGPAYTIAMWALARFGIYWTMFPIFDFGEALVTSGSFVRLGLLLLAAPILPAALLLRVIAFRRAAPRRKPATDSTLAI